MSQLTPIVCTTSVSCSVSWWKVRYGLWTLRLVLAQWCHCSLLPVLKLIALNPLCWRRTRRKLDQLLLDTPPFHLEYPSSLKQQLLELFELHSTPPLILEHPSSSKQYPSPFTLRQFIFTSTLWNAVVASYANSWVPGSQGKSPPRTAQATSTTTSILNPISNWGGRET